MLLKRNRSFNIYWIIPIFFLFAYTYSYTQVRYTWDNIPNQVKERKAFKRFEWFYRQRALPFDTIPDGAIERARQNEIRKERNLSRTIQSANLTWSQIGPTGVVSTWPSQWGVVSGRVRAIAVHPTDPNTVYVGPAAGGVWKTTDGGTSWQDVGFNLASLTFGAIAIDPSNPSIVYAGAGEAMRYFNTIMYDGKGLYKSTDAGASWTQITNGIGSRTHFGAVKVSPTNSSTVYAALASGYWHWGYPGNEGLWRSTDAGITWTRTLNVDDGFDVLPHPTTANRVYGATGGGVSTAGFYISTDNGGSWTKSSSGLPTSTLIDRIQIALSSSTPATIYALIFDGTNNTMTLYKSTNDGSSWAATSSSYSSGQGWYDLVLGVNPTNVNEVYIGDAELRRSTDGGVNFSYVGGSYWSQSMHVDFHYMVFAPSNSAYRYIGCDGGIYRSTNSGSSWTNLNNLPTLQYYRLSSHPTNQNIVLGGAQDNGLYQTTNGGAGNWTLVSTGDGMESFYDYTNPNTVYASTQNGGLVKSTTGGNYGSFYNIQPYTGSQPWAWTAPFIIHPTNNLTIYTATDRPWRSTDGGSSWAALTGSALTSVAINTMAQSPVNPNNMILAGSEYTYSPTVHISINGGTVWTDVTANIGGTARYISRVVFHPTQGSTVFVVRSGFSTGNKIYRSTNLGTTWTNISGDLPDVPHNDLFIDPAITTEMYTANDLGVYRSTNDGTNWIRQGNNFPYVPTHDFDYFNSGGVRLLRAGTHGRSAYQATLLSGPYITSFTPSSGSVGTTVTISGSGFDPTPSNNVAYFGGVKATVTAGSSTSLSVTVPAGATYAPISVTTGNLTVYSSAFFKVTFPTGSGIIDTASFAIKTDFSTQTSPWGVGVADVDGDGKLDVGVANSGSSSISILRNTSTTSSISFAAKVDFSLGDPSTRNLAFGDLDGDSLLDVAAVRQSNNSVGVFRNTSTAGSISLASRQDFGVSTNPFDLVIGDIDGDGKPDIAVANDSNMTVLRNTSTVGSISFATNIDFVTGNGQRSIAIGDFDGDSKPDIATVSINYSILYVFRNTSTSGSISFASAVQYSTGNAVYEVAVGDVDNDSKLDISVINNLDNTVSVFRNTCTVGNISFDARVNFTIGNGGSCIALENINGDVKPDVIAANYTDNTLSILRNTSASISFDGKVDFGTGTNPYGCISGDIDGNGAPELIAANQANNTVSILRNRLADTYIITASVIGNGSITPSGSVVVLHGANQSFTITPNVGHHIDSITVDGTRVDSTTSYTFYNVTYGHTITAYFSINQYTITASSVGNGTIAPSGSIIVTHGTNQPFTISPAANHHVDSIVVDGVKVDSTTGYTFLNIVTGHTITAYFSIDTYTIIASATSNGWISPSGTIIVTHGSNQLFTFGPNPNAVFDSLFVDDLYIDSSSSYTFYNVTANHTIHAKFLSTVHTITVVQNVHGTITPATTDVPHGGSQTFIINPDVG
ncbi:MAG: VCBS repeat-containing protein, partial [Ignavibacteriales bacterium]|nr:VCBS repeat-containing protein [Ignavibacteriales bacterium]